MKYLILILLTSLFSCKSVNMHQTISTWGTNPTNKTTKIKAVTAYYGGYEGLRNHTLDVLLKLGFEIDNSTNPILTKPKLMFGRWARYSVSISNTEVIISGEVVESSLLGTPSDVNSSNFNGTPIVRGSGQFGTAWFEKMTVIAEAMREAAYHYSDN
jgi:hypothetical protein